MAAVLNRFSSHLIHGGCFKVVLILVFKHVCIVWLSKYNRRSILNSTKRRVSSLVSATFNSAAHCCCRGKMSLHLSLCSAATFSFTHAAIAERLRSAASNVCFKLKPFCCHRRAAPDQSAHRVRLRRPSIHCLLGACAGGRL